jgi:hypothetical protein
VGLSKLPHKVGLVALSEGWRTEASLSLEWHDCPVAIGLYGITAPVITSISITIPPPGRDRESVAILLTTRRQCAAEVA